MIATNVIGGNDITLRDVMYGGFWPETYAAIKPMADGEHFARMSRKGTISTVRRYLRSPTNVSPALS